MFAGACACVCGCLRMSAHVFAWRCKRVVLLRVCCAALRCSVSICLYLLGHLLH